SRRRFRIVFRRAAVQTPAIKLQPPREDRVRAGLLCFTLAMCAGAACAQSASAPPARGGGMLSSAAESVYTEARPRLVQVRTVVVAAGRQSSIGSGFLVSGDGLALTNYHVVSQYALEPRTYRLEYAAPDGSSGTLSLLGIDIANDLAVV